MNTNKHKEEIELWTESSDREQWSDEARRSFHHAVLKFISVAVKNKHILLPLGIYYQYKGYVKLTDRTYTEMQKIPATALAYVDAGEMYLCYRRQAEIRFCLLYQLIVSTYQNSTFADERDNLYNLLNAIDQLLPHQLANEAVIQTEIGI